jgi:hypothetical protein
MKINKTYQVELSIEDCKRCLNNHQYDAISMLVEEMQKDERLTSVTDVSNFVLGLLRGERGRVFEDLVEEYSIKWIDTPTFNSGYWKLVEQYPGTFELEPLIKQYVYDAHGVTKLQVTVDGLLIDTKEILANI